jgi:hypothetical protein
VDKPYVIGSYLRQVSQNPQKIQRLLEYDQSIKQRIDGDNPVAVPGLLDLNNRVIDVYDGTNDVQDPMEPEAVQDKANNYTDEAYDQLISAQVMLPACRRRLG